VKGLWRMDRIRLSKDPTVWAFASLVSFGLLVVWGTSEKPEGLSIAVGIAIMWLVVFPLFLRGAWLSYKINSKMTPAEIRAMKSERLRNPAYLLILIVGLGGLVLKLLNVH